MTIGDKIKRLRNERGMTQEELGKMIGVQKAAINKYETGIVVNLKKEIIQKLARALDVNPVWLMDEEDGWPPMPSSRYFIQQILDDDGSHPRTPEARILAKGIDRMPQEQREAIMNMMMGLYPNVFKKGTEDDDT